MLWQSSSEGVNRLPRPTCKAVLAHDKIAMGLEPIWSSANWALQQRHKKGLLTSTQVSLLLLVWLPLILCSGKLLYPFSVTCPVVGRIGCQGSK